jgi:putative membrane protein
MAARARDARAIRTIAVQEKLKMADNKAGNPSVSVEDANFVHQATAGAVAEVMMGQLAVERATGDPARNLGQLMVRDHSNKDQELGQILQNLSLRPATQPDPEQLAQYQQLQNAPADHFDATYARIFVEEHQWMIAVFEREITSGQDPTLKSFAIQTLPLVQEHLAMAKKILQMHPMRGSK